MQRVVITGMGLCSSLGHSRAQVVTSLHKRQNTFCLSDVLPDIVVSPVRDTGDDAATARLKSWRHRRYLSRGGTLAVLAGLRAVEDARLPRLPEDMGLIGCAAPTLDVAAEQGLAAADPLLLDALWLLRWLPGTPVSALATLLGVHGPGLALGCACASGLAALGEGWLRIRHGVAPCLLVACGDSRLSLGGLLGYARARTLSHGFVPQEASRPFDRARNGFVPGEGGAALVLESLEHARARGARIWAEVLGYGASLDAGSLAAPDAEGRFAQRAIEKALQEASCTAADLDWVSTHGTGTRLNDEMEAGVLRRMFAGELRLPLLAAVKSWTGHLASACGALEAVVCLWAAAEGFLPLVRNLEHPLAADLPFVTERTQWQGRSLACGLVENFGFGGQNAALMLRLWQEKSEQ